MTKQEARKISNERVREMHEVEKEWASGAIVDYLSEFEPFCHAHNLFVFLGTNNEPNTEEIVGLGLMLERTVSVPRVEKNGMHAVCISLYTNFRRAYMNILEPVGGHDIVDIDVAIVPIVAFDGLNRVGHGKGYYDKFLAEHNCLKIGIAFDCQEVSGVDFCSHDVQLDMIVTEKRIISKDRVAKNPYGD